jgi:hypothetical protein
MSVEDMIRGFDGADWNELREKGHVPRVAHGTTEALYPFGYTAIMPEWVKKYDARETWLEMMRLVTLRECAIHQHAIESLCTPEIKEALLTLRIYREDIEFWEQYETELEHLVHHFMKHTIHMPALDYGDLDTYVKTKMQHLSWSQQDMSHALVIIAKIRGQLRPLRHRGFDLNEFTFGVVRNSVPTELRPDVLESWHHMIDPGRKTHAILGDMWRMACISSIIQGRNIPLYQYTAVLPRLQEKEQQDMVKVIEEVIPSWIMTQEHPSFHYLFEAENIRPIQFDMMTEKCAYYFFFDPNYVPTMEDKILLLLKQYAYEELFDRSLEQIGFLNMSTGFIIRYEMTSTIRAQLSQLWKHLQRKYHLYLET